MVHICIFPPYMILFMHITIKSKKKRKKIPHEKQGLGLVCLNDGVTGLITDLEACSHTITQKDIAVKINVILEK